jgi:hypothetical protein
MHFNLFFKVIGQVQQTKCSTWTVQFRKISALSRSHQQYFMTNMLEIEQFYDVKAQVMYPLKI